MTVAASPFWNGMPSRIKPAKPKAKGIAAHPLIFWSVVLGLSLSGWISASVAFGMVGAAKAEAATSRARLTEHKAEMKAWNASMIQRATTAIENGNPRTLGTVLASMGDYLANHPDDVEVAAEFSRLFDEAIKHKDLTNG